MFSSKLWILLLLACLALPFRAYADDPCQNAVVTKSTAQINISTTAGNTVIVPAVAGKVTYLCGYQFSLSGTTPTARFLYGTQTTTPCDTGASTSMASMSITAGTITTMMNNATVMSTAVGNQLCINLGGTNPSAFGLVVYVQQ